MACSLLAVNRSRIYYKKKSETEENIVLMNEIRDIYEKHPFYGYRRITHILKRISIKCNKKRIQRLMKTMGLQALYPQKKTSLANAQHKKYPYLLRELMIERINQVWQVDITYIKIGSGYGYLICLIDVYSRKVMSWALSPFLDTKAPLEALEKACSIGKPEIINSDQGCQFTSNDWITMVEKDGIQVSMNGKGRWCDNVYVERLWRTIKWEAVYLHCFDSLAVARKILGEYIEFYNQERLHQSLDYQTPDEIYYGRSIHKGSSESGQKNLELQPQGGVVNSQIQPIFLS
jgi:putative transposase